MDAIDRLHILVVEDDADTRDNLRDILELDDHRVDLAGTAASALARPDWSTISVVILDRRLPDATADELLPRLRCHAPWVDIIVVTGYTDLEGAIAALRQGATDYILKPISPDELRARLRRIAEYRRDRQSLQLAERRNKMLVQNSSDMIAIFDAEGTIVYQNPTIRRILGRRPSERVGLNIFNDPIVHPDDREAVRTFVETTRRHPGEPIVASLRLRHADGSWRTFEVVGQDLLEEPGAGAVVASYRDQTERMRAQEDLRASEERFRRLFDAGIVGIGVADTAGKWVEANDELLRIVGHSRGELAAGKLSWAEMTPPRYRETDRLAIGEAKRRGACVPYEKEYILRDGTLVPVLLGFATLGTEGDRLICLVRDITETKRAEDMLRRERDFAQGLIDGAPAIVLMLDESGRIIRFNRYGEDLSGYGASEIQGRDFFSTLIPERDRSRVRESFRRTLAGGHTSGTVNPILTRDGREREIRWSNRVIRDTTGEVGGVLAIGQDVTDLKEAQERALRAERLAAIGEMVTGLAHESRNALQRSQACLEMLSLQVEDQPEALDLIDRLQKAQDHLHHLYEDVRGYAAPIRLEKRACDLAVIWQDAWSHLERARRGRSGVLSQHDDDVDRRCRADPFRLGQVFGNILENALAACPDSVVVEIGYQPALLDGIPAIRMSVRDNGPGLGLEARRRIFEPFYTTKIKGTGLGMAISRRIVEAHGGRIAVGDGPGAEILITLPRGDL